LFQARINWEGCGRKGIWRKNGDTIVGVSASVIFPDTIKSRRRFLLAPADLGSPEKRSVKRLPAGQTHGQTTDIVFIHTLLVWFSPHRLHIASVKGDMQQFFTKLTKK